MGNTVYSTISALFQTSAALLAVSTALMVVVPSFGQQALKHAGKYSKTIESRAYRNILIGFGLPTALFFLGTLLGILGLIFPCDNLALGLASIVGAGVLAMAVSAAMFAFRAFGEIQ